MWLKNRMEECGYFKPLIGCATTDIRMGCEMHVFFIGIEETEEMLQRIMTPDETADRRDRIARSKIGKTQLKDIFPIDANAAAVVSPEFQRN